MTSSAFCVHAHTFIAYLHTYMHAVDGSMYECHHQYILHTYTSLFGRAERMHTTFRCLRHALAGRINLFPLRLFIER